MNLTLRQNSAYAKQWKQQKVGGFFTKFQHNQFQIWTSKLEGIKSAFQIDQSHLKTPLEQEVTPSRTQPATQVWQKNVHHDL